MGEYFLWMNESLNCAGAVKLSHVTEGWEDEELLSSLFCTHRVRVKNVWHFHTDRTTDRESQMVDEGAKTWAEVKQWLTGRRKCLWAVFIFYFGGRWGGVGFTNLETKLKLTEQPLQKLHRRVHAGVCCDMPAPPFYPLPPQGNWPTPDPALPWLAPQSLLQKRMRKGTVFYPMGGNHCGSISPA